MIVISLILKIKTIIMLSARFFLAVGFILSVSMSMKKLNWGYEARVQVPVRSFLTNTYRCPVDFFMRIHDNSLTISSIFLYSNLQK